MKKLNCKFSKTHSCCQNFEGVYLRPEEAYWMRLRFGDKIQIVKKNNRDLLLFKNNRCPFLNNKLDCAIYNNRPRVCYWYPVDFRELARGKIKLLASCEFVQENYNYIVNQLKSLTPPEDGTKEPDRRLFRLKVDIICEIFGFSRDIPRGNKHAQEMIKIW